MQIRNVYSNFTKLNFSEKEAQTLLKDTYSVCTFFCLLMHGVYIHFPEISSLGCLLITSLFAPVAIILHYIREACWSIGTRAFSKAIDELSMFSDNFYFCFEFTNQWFLGIIKTALTSCYRFISDVIDEIQKIFKSTNDSKSKNAFGKETDIDSSDESADKDE